MPLTEYHLMSELKILDGFSTSRSFCLICYKDTAQHVSSCCCFSYLALDFSDTY